MDLQDTPGFYRYPLPVRNALMLFGSLATLVALWGCGGACASGSTSGSAALTVQTDWTLRANQGNAQSERVRLLDANGLVAASLVLNQDSAQTSRTFPAVATGTYHLQAQLFSLRDAGGAQLGTVDETLNLTQDQTLRFAIGSNAAGVAVTPSTATFAQQHSQQFYAKLQDATGNLVYSSSAIVWSALGGVASISQDGVLIGATAGTGSVRASVSGLSVPGAATFTVTPQAIAHSKWTLLVYMNAANDLDSFSLPNILQMQKAAGNSQVRFVVQWKQAQLPDSSPTPTFIGTRRYLIAPDSVSKSLTSQLIQDLGPNIDMGTPSTLSDFIQWGRQNYPSDRLGVVVWNHGNGWRSRQVKSPAPTRGASYDDSTGNHIDTWDLATALGAGGQLDFLAWDASLMQMAEVAYEIKDSAKYMVGSEQSPPGAGYPYDLIFGAFRDNPDAPTATLCGAFADGMLAFYTAGGTHITQSVVDLSKMPALATATKPLAQALVANQSSLATNIATARQAAQAYPPGDTLRTYRDIGGLCQSLGGSAQLASSCSAVQAALAGTVLYERHSTDSNGSTGLSIDFSTAAKFGPVSADYAKLKWAKDTGWDQFLTVAP